MTLNYYNMAKATEVKARNLLSSTSQTSTKKNLAYIKKMLLKAADLYTLAIKQDPLNIDAHIGRGEIFWLPIIGKIDDCFIDLENALKLDSNNSEILAIIAYKWFYLNEFEKGKDYLKKSIYFSLDHINTGLMLESLGDCYRKLEDYSKAIECYTNAMEILHDTDFLGVQLFYYRGFCFYKIGWIKGAKLDYKEFLKYEKYKLHNDLINYLEPNTKIFK